jgi:hypothetical protein
MFDVYRGDSMTVLRFNGYGSCGISDAANHAAVATINRDGDLCPRDKKLFSANVPNKLISRDCDGCGTFDSIEDFDIAVNADTTRTNVLTVKKAVGTFWTVTSYLLAPVGVAGNDNCRIEWLAA